MLAKMRRGQSAEELSEKLMEAQQACKDTGKMATITYQLKIKRSRLAGDTARIGYDQYHRISEVGEGGAFTLFISGRHRGTWGFLVDGVKVPWREYLGIDKEAA